MGSGANTDVPTRGSSEPAEAPGFHPRLDRSTVALALPLYGHCNDGMASVYSVQRLWPPRRVKKNVVPHASQLVAALARGDFQRVARHAHPDGICLRLSNAPCTPLSVKALRGCAKASDPRFVVSQGDDQSEPMTCAQLMRKHVAPPAFAKSKHHSPTCDLHPAYSPTGPGPRPPVVVPFYVELTGHPWQALVLGFVENHGKLQLVELTTASWRP